MERTSKMLKRNASAIPHVDFLKRLMSAMVILATVLLSPVGSTFAEAPAEIRVHELPEYQAADATAAIQKAVDSGAQRVIVSAGHEWVLSRQITVDRKQNVSLVFERGVSVEAKEGAFLPTGECLLVIRNSQHIRIEGYGATLRMRKKDYQNPKLYKPAEWRNTLSILGCDDVTVRGLALESSGGDGIYVAESRGDGGRRYSSNITIEDVRAVDHHRQGMSVISVDGLTVRRCEFSGTQGAAPEAGIDFEPDEGDHRLANILIQDCLFDGNAGAAIHFWISNLTREAPPISIVVERAQVTSGRLGFYVGDDNLGEDRGRTGSILFRDSTLMNTAGPALLLRNKTSAANDVHVVFEGIRLWNVATGMDDRRFDSPIVLEARDDSAGRLPLGGVAFRKIRIRDSFRRPVLRTVFADQAKAEKGIADLQGDLQVYGELPEPPSLGEKQSDVNLKLQRLGWADKD
jgi:hypothetical protein